jgi:hypothetical protein
LACMSMKSQTMSTRLLSIIDWEQQTFSLHEEDDRRNTVNKVNGMKNEALFTMDLSTFCEKYALEGMLVN